MDGGRRVHRVAQAADLLGVSEDFVYDEIRRGRLRARKLGRFLVVVESDLAAYVGALPDAAPHEDREDRESRQPIPLRRTGTRVERRVFPLPPGYEQAR